MYHPTFMRGVGDFERLLTLRRVHFPNPFPAARSRWSLSGWLFIVKSFSQIGREPEWEHRWIGSGRWSNQMNYDVIDAQYLKDHTIRIHFRDGSSGVIDLASEMYGPVFEPLRDPAEFRRFKVDPTWHTLVWPNGADIAPEHLYYLAVGSLPK